MLPAQTDHADSEAARDRLPRIPIATGARPSATRARVRKGYTRPANRGAARPRSHSGTVAPAVISWPLAPALALPSHSFGGLLRSRPQVRMLGAGARRLRKLGGGATRDNLVVMLNSHYEGQATGETFNRSGKTDNLVRVEDRNVFIGECKWWPGASASSMPSTSSSATRHGATQSWHW